MTAPRFIGAHTEWDPLEEVILGTAAGAHVPSDGIDQQAIESRHMSARPHPGPIDPQVLGEAEEDLSALATLFERCGVRVRRPDPIRVDQPFGTEAWQSTGFHAYCPRDSLLVVGETIIETPMVLRARQLEVHAYRTLLREYFRTGARWLAAPRPELQDRMYDVQPASPQGLCNHEPAFDAANVLRAGRDLFYLISDSGNAFGADWLERTLGPGYRVHRCAGIYNGVHLDSTIGFVRPGLVVLNASRITEETLPAPLRNWDKIWCNRVHDIGHAPGVAYSSKWVGMNFLMVRPDLAFVDGAQVDLIQALEARGVDVAPIRLRHARTLGGGVHCATLDMRRRGPLDCYFDKAPS